MRNCKMRKFSFLLFSLVIALCLTMFVPSVVPYIGIETVEAATQKPKIKLNYTKKTAKTDSKFKLKLLGTKKKVKWSTSNPYIAVVRENGTVLTDGAGKCVITAKVGGKKYKCYVTVKDTYGTVTGNVTYHYNQYRGYVPDTGSVAILINGRYNFQDGRHGYEEIKDDELGDLDSTDIEYLNSKAIDGLKRIGIYATKVDGNGNFTFNHVPTAENYNLIIISKETTTGGWFDYYDDSISDASDEYYEYVANQIGLYDWNDYKLRNLISRAVGYHAYTSKDVTVYKNETTHITHEFPYTYI